MIVEVDFPDHWKTRMLVDLLDGDEAAPVYLLRLWAHCQVRRQWMFDSLPPTALKALCRYPGHPNKLESGLASSGFIRRDGAGALTVLNWDEYNCSLVANWENGKLGGRPKKPTGNPNPDSANPSVTDRVDREDGLEKKEKKERKSKAFQPPTVDQVRAYCLERKNGIDPDAFLAHYETNGWVQGKGKPIVDWKAAVRTWESNRKAAQSVSRVATAEDLARWNPVDGGLGGGT